jgi:hypothetical protein
VIHASPPFLPALVLAAGVAALMLRIGIQSKLLEWRHQSRRCPSCGRLLTARVCRHCGGRRFVLFG